jgi:hypothetical protein
MLFFGDIEMWLMRTNIEQYSDEICKKLNDEEDS